MAFTSSAIPIGQQFVNATTITTAESYLYTLMLYIISARDLSMVVDQLCQATQISNFLFALNDPNLSAANIQAITLGLNNIVTPFNSQVYPILNL